MQVCNAIAESTENQTMNANIMQYGTACSKPAIYTTGKGSNWK
jgi:hypothetical protein